MKSTLLFSSVIMMALVLHTSCDDVKNEFSTANFSYHAIGVVDEKSQTHRPDTSEAHKSRFMSYIFDQIHLDDEGVAIDYYSIIIGNPVPQWDSVRLEGRNMLISSVFERKTDEEHFKAKVQASMDSLLSSPFDHKVSNIYRGLVYAIALLDTAAHERTLIVRSDYREESGITFFDKIKVSPDQYQTLRDQFTAAQPLPKGITENLHIIFILTDQSERSFQSMKFFEWLFIQTGARVSIRSSL